MAHDGEEGSTMRVFYRPEQAARRRKYSPSPAKPRLVAEDWLERKLPIEIATPFPASIDLMYRAHDKDYVDGILNGSVLNGFGDSNVDVIRSLPYTCGAMIDATVDAFSTNLPTVALCSGFHHAKHCEGGDFCTFNGLIMASQAVRDLAPTKKVGILDCDYHYGNGTDNIIDTLQLDWIQHVSVGKTHFMEYQAEEFLHDLPCLIESFKGVSVLIYQAGADPYLKDPLGGWLTIEQLQLRDWLVFSIARHLNIPIVWNLAGGYKKDKKGNIPEVLEIHRNTLLACMRAWA